MHIVTIIPPVMFYSYHTCCRKSIAAAEILAVALGYELLLVVNTAIFLGAVGGDVVLHVTVGQVVAMFLLGVLADVPLHDGIQGGRRSC